MNGPNGPRGPVSASDVPITRSLARRLCFAFPAAYAPTIDVSAATRAASATSLNLFDIDSPWSGRQATAAFAGTRTGVQAAMNSGGAAGPHWLIDSGVFG